MVNWIPSIISLAQIESRAEEVVPFALSAAILGAVCVGFLVVFAIHALICYFLMTFLNRLPAQYRQQQPGMVWLLMIPLFNVVWNFFVYPKISASYKSYLDSKGYQNHGDAGMNLALAYCILAIFCFIPYLGACVGIAALIVLIIYLVKINGYKDLIDASPDITPTPHVV